MCGRRENADAPREVGAPSACHPGICAANIRDPASVAHWVPDKRAAFSGMTWGEPGVRRMRHPRRRSRPGPHLGPFPQAHHPRCTHQIMTPPPPRSEIGPQMASGHRA